MKRRCYPPSKNYDVRSGVKAKFREETFIDPRPLSPISPQNKKTCGQQAPSHATLEGPRSVFPFRPAREEPGGRRRANPRRPAAAATLPCPSVSRVSSRIRRCVRRPQSFRRGQLPRSIPRVFFLPKDSPKDLTV